MPMPRIVAILLALALVGPPSAASAQTCPPYFVLECTKPNAQGLRHCECRRDRGQGKTPGGGKTSGGKAEIDKKNVPTVRPNKSPGAND